MSAIEVCDLKKSCGAGQPTAGVREGLGSPDEVGEHPLVEFDSTKEIQSSRCGSTRGGRR